MINESEYRILENEIKKISSKLIRKIKTFKQDDFEIMKDHMYKKSGLYFIFENEKIIYVGKAVNLYGRLANHIHGAKKSVGTKHAEIKRRKNIMFGYVAVPRD